MRIRTLNLTRFGKFTDRSLDFGEKRDGQPDFHVIYGPNEAGKSTLFAAWLDFLYGIDTRSPYNFLHDYKTMQIGAAIETGGIVRSFSRVKRNSASLLDQHDQPIAEQLIGTEMGGLDRDAYRNMFSLDEATLEKGGDAILDSKGDLGRLLFSASAGLADLNDRLDQIREEQALFFKPSGRSHELAELKRQLEDLKQRQQEIDIAQPEYAKLTSTRDRARTEYEKVNQQRTSMRLRLEECRRILAALPQFSRLKTLASELAALPAQPAAPLSWNQDIIDIRKILLVGNSARARIASELEQLEQRLSELGEAMPILAIVAEIDALKDLAGRVKTEIDDMPRRVSDVAEADRDIAQILHRLGRANESDPQALILPDRIIGTLTDLTDRRSVLDERLTNARREAAKAADALKIAEDGLVENGQSTLSADRKRDHDQLADLVRQARATDLNRHANEAARAVTAAKAILATSLAAFNPAMTDDMDLAALILPAKPVLADLRSRLSEAEKTRSRLDEKLGEKQAELAGQIAKRGSAASMPGMITDQAAQALRAEREAAWHKHRESLQAKTAEEFRTLLDQDDALANQRLWQVSQAANLRQIEQEVARLTAEVEQARTARDQAQGRLDILDAELRATVAGVSDHLPKDMTVLAFEQWCDGAREAQRDLAALGQCERDQAFAVKNHDGMLDDIRTILAGFGEKTAHVTRLHDLLVMAQVILDGEAERQNRLKTFEQCRAETRIRNRDLAETTSSLDTWEQEWQAACNACWLGETAETLTTGVVSALINTQRQLQAPLLSRATAQDRITKMQADIDLFSKEAGQLAKRLGVQTEATPLMTFRSITDHLDSARQIAGERKVARERHDALMLEKTAQDTLIAENDARIAAMAAHFGVETLEDVSARLDRQAERAKLDQARAELETTLMESLSAPDMATVESRLADADRLALEAEIGDLTPKVEALDEETNTLYVTLRDAERTLERLGDDNDVANIAEARKTLLIDIETRATRYLSLRLGALATEQALRLYREKHRSSMMVRASEAFSRISRAAYKGLDTIVEPKGEKLIAIAADGSSKQADELSKGTRFQLYLALRIAGYQDHVSNGQVVPFIADDIMESFDEMRAGQALNELAMMGQAGQVIYLTHHQHIADIARDICPGVTIHAL